MTFFIYRWKLFFFFFFFFFLSLQALKLYTSNDKNPLVFPNWHDTMSHLNKQKKKVPTSALDSISVLEKQKCAKNVWILRFLKLLNPSYRVILAWNITSQYYFERRKLNWKLLLKTAAVNNKLFQTRRHSNGDIFTYEIPSYAIYSALWIFIKEMKLYSVKVSTCLANTMYVMIK